jgi:hypothetical protein
VRWVQRFPGRLDYEIADFQSRGLAEFLVDGQEFERGRVVLDGSIEHDGEWVRLRVVYPDAYPYFRPEVFAPELRLGRHQNPFEGNLCLLEASTRAWRTTETAASLIAQQVPFLLDLVKAGGMEMTRNEVPQGEPDSYYVGREHGTAVFVPEEALRLPPGADCGQAYFAFSPDRVGPAVHLLLRQVNARARSGGGKRIAVADAKFARRFPGPTVEGRWVRVDRSPGREPADYFAAAEAVRRGFGEPLWQRSGEDELAILGVVFPEEVKQGVWEDAWLFAVRFRTRNPARNGAYLTKGERVAAEDFFARIPRLRGLETKTAALLGLGSLGAPLALELARAQLGELRILDNDLVETGTIVRWPIGIPAVGSRKTAVIEATIASHYPRTSCHSFQHRLGAALEENEGPNDFDLIDELLRGTDLVVDATAELAVQQLLADLAREQSLPQLYFWGTEGSYGGAVVRCLPGETGCWFCLQLAIEDGSIPGPPHEPGGTTQPRGCGTPTFTGESFNLLPLVAQAARVASATLLGTLPAGQDAFVLSLRDGDVPAAAPQWTAYALTKHPRCPHCAAE